MKYLLFLLLNIGGNWGLAQPGGNAPAVYFFEGDTVVFEFDLDAYQWAKSKEGLDFNDLDIDSIIVYGDLENWQSQSWTMRQVEPGRYQLRKPLSSFQDVFPEEFKYFIREGDLYSPIIYPELKSVNSSLWNSLYNISPYHIRYDPDGNVQFFLSGHLWAKEVVLAGTFNEWNETALQMEKTKEGWYLPVSLAPGRYEYKFIVDGDWIHDPSNPNRVKNEFETLNSVLRITKEHKFVLSGFEAATEVYLAGSFNAWKTDELPMERMGTVWEVQIPLVGGKHHYKFIVDGTWILDPENTLKERDSAGNINSVLFVR